MKLTSPAKINLNLHVTGRRADGYHLLQSDMVFTHWGDEISITPSDQFTLTADGPYSNIFTGELLSTNRGAPNLIVRAVYAMADKANKNAAAVMHALNDMWGLNLSMDELCTMGVELGAELPVCLHAPQPCRVSGIGDVIEPIEVAPLNLLIVWPDADASLLTKDVFDLYRQDPPIKSEDDNHLADAAISLCPEIGDLITVLQASEGCQTASMSGSGSACFGIFETLDQAEAAKSQFKNAIVTVIRS